MALSRRRTCARQPGSQLMGTHPIHTPTVPMTPVTLTSHIEALKITREKANYEMKLYTERIRGVCRPACE